MIAIQQVAPTSAPLTMTERHAMTWAQTGAHIRGIRPALRVGMMFDTDTGTGYRVIAAPADRDIDVLALNRRGIATMIPIITVGNVR